MTDSMEMKVVVTKDGPYLVSGSVPLAIQVIGGNSKDESWDWLEGKTFELEAEYALCRCGHSKQAPFCDGTHEEVKFDGTETAVRKLFEDQATEIAGTTMVLEDAKAFCAGARYCDAVKDIWDSLALTGSPEVRERAIHQATQCPSGRLVLRDKETKEVFELDVQPSIGVVEDPIANCSGPIWVRGCIQVQSSDGFNYEVRNRVTLCRCGKSGNKPFCDGKHLEIEYKDGIQ